MTSKHSSTPRSNSAEGARRTGTMGHRYGLWGAGLGALSLAALGWSLVTTTVTQAQAQGSPPAPTTQAGEISDGGALPAPSITPAAPSPRVKIVFKTIPPGPATVSWGKKKLGFIKPRAPLVVERPRDSGPLDVIVRAEGCVPVHTRAYTFTDSTLLVKITPIDKKNTLFGYREAPPPDEDGGVPSSGGGPDAGASIPLPTPR